MAQSKEARKIVPVDRLAEILDEFGQEALLDVEEQGMKRVTLTLEAKAVELAPIDKGDLEQSTVVRVFKRAMKIVGQVIFGVPYAAEVHELPDNARGPRTRAKPGNEYGPAGPKYMERPLRGFQQDMRENLAEFLQEVWKRKARGRRRR